MYKFIRLRLKTVILIIIAFFILDFIGLFTHLCELDYDHFFHFPSEEKTLQYLRKQKKGYREFNDFSEQPAPHLNIYNYKFIRKNIRGCNAYDDVRLTLIIKSAIGNSARRHAIRQTWGRVDRFSDVPLVRVFVLGTSRDPDTMENVYIEAEEEKDILQANFLDSYFNNTIKTMVGMRWAVQNCHRSSYFMFVDDDYYVSLKNVLRFIPQRPVHHVDKENNSLFAGYVMKDATPHRHKFSKWYITLAEYPFDRWPPYVTAGAFILTRDSLEQMYNTSLYTRHFRFDDIFLGFVAMKAKMTLTHCEEFHFHRPKYQGPESYRSIIASHGFSDHTEMDKIWNECRSAGYA